MASKSGRTGTRRALLVHLVGVLLAVPLVAVVTVSVAPQGHASPGLRMFAMGNSYLSGQGADSHQTIPADMSSYRAGTTGPDNYCFRSRHAAVEVVARELGARFTNATCANSEPRHIDQTVQFDEGRQIDHLPADSDVVVMQVIGNPEFIKVVGCVQLGECDPRTVEKSLRVLDVGQRLHERRIYREVKARAPRAHIYTLGAPQVVPRVGQEYRTRCGWFLSDREVRLLNSFIGKVNEISRDNARRAGETFVDLARPGSGWNDRHDLCAADAWEWGPRVAAPQHAPDGLQFRHWILGSYHPTIAGQRASAAVLVRYIREREGLRS
ncbi:SGNH/GDSL hydrolase family protein [Gordonia insulae]|uniref:Lipase 2 n=1 Tax=Gordonia insulae TaxID=2420509 RepID=A0A3G8JIU6_9ACTN|nr:GDSL-type esterase/lipase family protein [Gordonia insulae]AZG45007.1 Lipase 2 [Gordonia insulae]